MVTRNWDRVPVYGWYYKAPGTPDQGARLTFTITGAPHGVKRVDGRAIYRAGATQEVAVGKAEDQDPDVRNRVRQALRDRDEAALGADFDGIAWDAAWDAALPAAVFTSFYAQDDPDVTPQGFQISVAEATSGARRTYPIDLRLAMIDAAPVPGLNLADVELPAGTPVTPAPTYAKGQPGGVAPLDDAGLVPVEHLPEGIGGGGEGTQGPPGPQGDPGPPGERGEAGPPGADGQDGAPGTPGADGEDGKSAYQIARDHGYGGTETQWLATLKGEKGDKGDPGQDGAEGPQGPPGAPGEKGDPGDPATVNLGTIPAGTTLTVLYDSGWPARPTTRADIAVIWRDLTGASVDGTTVTDSPAGMGPLDTLEAAL